VVNEAEAAKVISKMVSLKGAVGVVVDLLMTGGRR
jgi:spore maturation protein SpmB